MNRKQGFTLIELLVVIAIIAILAAILFPVFAQAREKARAITCVSNMKEIALGVLMYNQDNDEKFPNLNNSTPATPQTTVDWQNMVTPYIKNGNNAVGQSGGVWSCPDFPVPGAVANYGIDLDLVNSTHAGYPGPYPGASISGIDMPSDKIMIVEKGRSFDGDGGGSEGNGYATTIPDSPYFPTDQTCWTRTSEGAGGSFYNADGSLNPNYPSHWDLQFDADVTTLVATSPGGSNLNGDFGCGAGDMPRYRHTGLTNVAFDDGHVKAMPKGRINYVNNIFIKGLSPTGY